MQQQQEQISQQQEYITKQQQQISLQNEQIPKRIAKEILFQSLSFQQRIDQFIFDMKMKIKTYRLVIWS